MFQSRRIIALTAPFLLAAGCREKAPAPTDSALAQDLAMAQRAGAAGPTVFNDAPIGGAASAAPAKGAPDPRPGPPRAKAPTPRPSPRREQPPAPVMRTPQPAPQQPVAVAQAPAPSPAPAPAQGIIGSGSRVGMNTNAQVCTAGLLPGDKFTATVTSGTVGTNGASIPAGATVVLEVAGIDRSDPIEASRIIFRVRSIDVNGEQQQVAGDVAVLASMDKAESSGGGNDRTKVIGGAVAGAVLGRILGKSTKATVIGAAAGAAAGTVAANRSHTSEACLPQGSPMRLTITRDIVVRSAI